MLVQEQSSKAVSDCLRPKPTWDLNLWYNILVYDPDHGLGLVWDNLDLFLGEGSLNTKSKSCVKEYIQKWFPEGIWNCLFNISF